MRRYGFLLATVLISTSTAFAASYIVPPDDVLVGKAQGIVIARATATWVEDTTAHGIETVTEFTVEDTLKGSVPHTFQIRMPGGHFGKVYKLVPGTPRFEIGAEELLFVNERATGDAYTTTDFGLGRFMLQYDSSGLQLARRDETELYGWDLKTGAPHREQLRDADKFIAYIRAIASGKSVPPDYFLPDRPLRQIVNSGTRKLQPVPQACTFGVNCTATSYTLTFDGTEGGMGGRWASFPTAVNWNRGNTETNAGNGGSDAINAAFSAWNGDALSNVNYVFASTTSNTNGIDEAPDGVNNIVFEKTIGMQPAFSCMTGGLLGVGGIQAASGSNMVGSETFLTNSEGDVSMNQGVGACIGGSLPVGDFNSAVTHEVGHTLGFRHSDQTRVGTAACTTISTYECSSSAIMTATVTNGLNATLQTWDQHAVRSVYPSTAAPAAVTAVEAHATSTSNVQVSWTGACATTCHIWRSSVGTAFTLLNPVTTVTTSPYNDNTASNGSAYLYKVTAFNGSESADSNFDLATVVIFTNTIVAGGVIKAVDTNEMRTAIDAVRTLDGIGAGSYTFGSGSPKRVTAGVDIIYALDVNEMRTNLDTAYFALLGSHPTYTNNLVGGGTLTVKALDFNEIRNWMR